jgi:DNA-binding transcriptional LysR family regulator
MDISLLRIFKAVAEEGSVSKAAERLNCVQSNVTVHIRQLEEDLNTVLFYRKPRGMALTHSGRTLLLYADKAIRLVQDAKRAVQETGSLEGPLSLGSTETAAAVRLPAVLARYHRKHPNVDLMLSTGTTEQLIGQVIDYKLDGAFVNGLFDHPDIEQEHVFDEELVLATAVDDDMTEAIKNPTLLVFREGCTYRARLIHWLREQGIATFKTMEFGTLEAVLGCVTAGMGITLFPRSVIARLQYTDKVKTFPVPDTMATVPTIFIRRRDTMKTKAVDELLKLARKEDPKVRRAHIVAVGK